MISTKEVCKKLGVSRSWVNKYLRHLGEQGPKLPGDLPGDKANLRTVYYDEGDIVAYLNANAVFSRQTEWLNLADCTDEEDARRTLKAIDAMPKENKEDREKAYWEFLDEVLPKGVAVFSNPYLSVRYRGEYPWKIIKGSIKTLDNLSTMAAMKGDHSEELIYRENFAFGRVRVTVHGRTWFMRAPELPLNGMTDPLYLLIPARGK